MSIIKVLCFSGSCRDGSLNQALAKEATRLAQSFGAQAQFADLRSFNMPLYDGDLEAKSGLPQGAKEFKHLLTEHQAMIIASPEYNSSISPLLKNAIDWASRQESKDEEGLSAFKDKVALLLSASPGNLGGLRGLVHLRSILGNIKVLVLPEQLSIPQASNAFAANGSLADQAKQASLKGMLQKLLAVTSKLAVQSS